MIPTRRASLLGLAAILLWSTTIAFSRGLTEQLGTLTAAACIYLLAGLFGLGFAAFQPGGLPQMLRMPRAYLLGCGALFVLYITALYLAVGLAANRTQVLTVGLINYLWPGLSLVFSIPILGRRARPALAAGILIALGGVWLAGLSGGGPSAADLLAGPATAGALLPYGLALLAAVSWGLYSNLSRRWGAGDGVDDNDGGAVPLFLLASGLVLALLRLGAVETTVWSPAALGALAYMALFPAMLAYALWDIAMRRGEITLVASLAYLTPLLSTLISALVLQVVPGPALWLGAGLVIAGALVCKVSVIDPTTTP